MTRSREPGGRAKPTRRQAAKEGSLLLLVEDVSINRQVLKAQLNLAGFVVDLARDGREGLRKFRRGGYALVFTDVSMPEMDGFALAREIRSYERARALPRTPVLALTPPMPEAEQRHGREAGIDGFIDKPPPTRELIACLRQWLPAVEWPAPQARAGEPLEAGVLDRLARGDKAQARSILAEFGASAAEDFAQLDAAVARRDARGVGREAHRIKGASRLIGATPMERAADSVERAAQRGDWAEIAEGVAALHRELSALQAHLRAV